MLPVLYLSQLAPTPVQAPILSACPFPQPSRVFSDPGLQGTEIDIFSYKPTLLTSKTLEKIRPVLDYRCMVSGSEQKFLLGLGVSLQLASYPVRGGGTLPFVRESRQLPASLSACSLGPLTPRKVFLETSFLSLSEPSVFILSFIYVFVYSSVLIAKGNTASLLVMWSFQGSLRSQRTYLAWAHVTVSLQHHQHPPVIASCKATTCP